MKRRKMHSQWIGPRIAILCGLALIMVFGYGCSSRANNGGHEDTYSSGTMTIYADETLKPLVEQERYAFEKTYPKAKINIIYTSESECLALFLKDSTKQIIISRPLTAAQLEYYKTKKLTVYNQHVADDGIGLLINRNAPDSFLSTLELKDLLEGKIMYWNQLNKKTPPKPIHIVFDRPNSSMLRYIVDKYEIDDKAFPKTYTPVDSQRAVIQRVMDDKYAIGIVSQSYMGRNESPEKLAYLKKTRAMTMEPVDSTKAEMIEEGFPEVDPQVYFLWKGAYPLVRPVYIISQESYNGLRTGFRNYVCGTEGQLIVQNMGLYPTFQKSRVVVIKEK